MFKKTLISTLVAASMLNSASALELGSFLFKLQGGYTMSDSSFTATQIDTSASGNAGTAVTEKIKNNNLNGFQGVVGFGYVASEDIWTDMTVSFDNTKTKAVSTNPAISQVENKNVTGLINAYYGFNMGNKFSPYVMCGFGVGMSKSKVTPPSEGMKIGTNTTSITNTYTTVSGVNTAVQLSSKNTSYFAYQGGFGISFEVMKSVALDLGYRVGNGNTAKFTQTFTDAATPPNKTDLTLAPKSQLKQSVLLGLNIAF